MTSNIPLQPLAAKLTTTGFMLNTPGEIKRWQRRELFRLNAPAGTKLCLTQHTARHELDVINISLGGTLAALVQTSPHDLENPLFADAQLLRDIELIFPQKSCDSPSRLKRSRSSA